jgi:hypothetical protein
MPDTAAARQAPSGKRVTIISVRSTDVPLSGPFWGKGRQPRHQLAGRVP